MKEYPIVRLRRVAKTIWIFSWCLPSISFTWADANKKVDDGFRKWNKEIEQTEMVFDKKRRKNGIP